MSGAVIYFVLGLVGLGALLLFGILVRIAWQTLRTPNAPPPQKYEYIPSASSCPIYRRQ